MSLLLAFAPIIAMAQAAPPSRPAIAPAEDVSEEIVVIGRRLANWRGSWKIRKGAVSCRTTRSSGDKAVDAVGCRALAECVTPLIPQMKAVTDSGVSKREKNQRMSVIVQPLGACISAKRNAAIELLARERAGLE